MIYRYTSWSIFFLGVGYFAIAFIGTNTKKSYTLTQKPGPLINLQDATYFEDLFRYEVAFPIEQTGTVLFDQPKTCVALSSYLFMTNDKGNELYRYHLDGTYKDTIAVQGEGPGEISKLVYGTRIFGNQVAFWDLFQHSIHVYDENGQHQGSLDFRNPRLTSGTWIPQPAAFKWPTPDEIIFSNAQIREHPDAQGAKTSVQRNDSGKITRVALAQPLGKRDKELERKFGESLIYHFETVGDVFWMGNPSYSSISIWNPVTQQSKSLMVQVPESLTLDAYMEIPRDDLKKISMVENWQGSIHRMISLPTVVFAKVGMRGYVPFSAEGKQLLNKRLISRFPRYQTNLDDTMVFIMARKNLKVLEEKVVKSPLIENEEAVLDEDQPCLVFATLKPEVQRLLAQP